MNIVPGATKWSGTREHDGYRTYKITHLVVGAKTEGPAAAMNTPGLPLPRSFWNFGTDVDIWAWCGLDMTVTPKLTEEANQFWEVEQTFYTKSDMKACRDERIDNPLLEPMKISGQFVKYTDEASRDRFGRAIVNSAWEQVRGPQVEFDKNRPSVKIEMQTPVFNTVALAYAMVDCLNRYPLWGFPRRCIKLSNAAWERKFYGVCSKYYTLSLDFDVRTGIDSFDKNLLDEGTKVLHGHWAFDKDEWILDTIGGIPFPRSPRLTFIDDPGGLPAGEYSYRVSSLNALGETLACPETTIVTTKAGDIKIDWNAVPGATGYKLYGRLLGLEQFLHQPPPLVTSYVDNGGAIPALPFPPDRDTTGGTEPDYRNLTHFDRYKDRRGENARLVLDGFGTPAGVLTIATDERFISRVNNNTGNSLLDTTKWIRVAKPLPNPTPPPWDSAEAYVVGRVVTNDPAGGPDPPTYICIVATSGAANEPPSTPWLKLTNGIVNAGKYEALLAYQIGYMVTRGVSNAGTVHVEKYDEADFLLLGIPLIF